jgi:hypothetical protein
MDIPAITFFKAHERLIIVVFALIFCVYLTYKGLGTWQAVQQNKETKLEGQLAQTQQQAAAAQQSAQQTQAQVLVSEQAAAQDRAATNSILQALSAQNAMIAQGILQRDKQTVAQQLSDSTATLPQLGQRFTQLVPGVASTDLKVAPDSSSVTIGRDTAQKTVGQLELVPQLQQDNKDLQTQADNSGKEVASVQKALDSESRFADNQGKLIATQDKYSALLQTQIDQGDKVCQEKINIEKTKAKKSFLKGFGIGSVFGFVGGLFVPHVQVP